MNFFAKVVQGKRKRKFICCFPNRSLPYGLSVVKARAR